VTTDDLTRDANSVGRALAAVLALLTVFAPISMSLACGVVRSPSRATEIG
jgi:hypothetical protein